MALLALPPNTLVGAGDHVGRLQVAVALLVPLPRDLGMRRPQVVVAFQHLAVAAVGGGIAYIGTGEGWPCLATVIDALHRKVVGWSMSGRMTEKPVADALEQAVERESPPDDFSLVFHDDQGSQHASRAFQRCLESHGIAQSMSRPGNPWDNASAESLFKTLKREPVNGKGCKTRKEAKQDVFKCIEPYCNRRRMHSSIGYNAPCDLERGIA